MMSISDVHLAIAFT